MRSRRARTSSSRSRSRSTEDELAAIEAFYADRTDGPLLMTGFNRRFSPPVARLRELLAGRTSPVVANYRMNAGYIPLDHWVHGPEGGGRNIGEACHIYDVFDALVEAEEVSVQAQAIGAESRHWAANDNFVATIGYADGSVCTLTYTALGHRDHPKERLDVYAGGRVYSLDDYKSLVGRRRRRRLAVGDGEEGPHGGARGAGAGAARRRPVADLARAAAAGDADQLRGRTRASMIDPAPRPRRRALSVKIPRRFGVIAMLTWGLAVAVYSVSVNNAAIPDHATLMGMRQDGVRASIRTLEEGGPPLVASSVGGKYDYELLPRGDDPGLYVYLPLVGAALGQDDPLLLIKWAFISLFAALLLVYPLIFYALFGSLLAGALAPLFVLWQFDFVRDTDIYWISAWVTLLCFPLLFLLARRRWGRGKVAALTGVMVVASFATSVRSFSGFGVLLAGLGLALTARRSWRYRLGVAGLLVVGYLSISIFAIDGVRAYRDARIEGTTAPPYLTTPWHSFYIGLGYAENRYGIRYDDAVAFAHAQRVDPNVQYLGEGYGAIMRKLYLDVLVDDPGLVARNIVLKTGVVLDDALRRFWYVLLLIPLLLVAAAERRSFRRDLLLLMPATLIAIAQPVLVMPFVQYEMGWLAIWGLVAVVGLAWIASLLPTAAEALAADPRVAAERAFGRGGSVRETFWRATSPWAWGGAAAVLVVIALLAGPLAPGRASFAAFYRQSETAPLASPSRATMQREWRLDDGSLDGWEARGGTQVHVSPGTGLMVKTNNKPADYQLVGPTVELSPGSYIAVVDGRVAEGGLEVGILDASAGRWLTTTHFWSEQQAALRAGGVMGASFTLSELRAVRIILSNWAPRPAPSSWIIRSVRLVEGDPA